MARVKGKNTSPERLLRAALWRAGFRYRLNVKTPVARPDIIFPGAKVAVFVDGCFWHGCPDHYSRPRSREEFWSSKLASNVERDRRQSMELEEAGWRVIRIWECEVFSGLKKIVQLIASVLGGSLVPKERQWRVVRVTAEPSKGVDWERRELELLYDGSVRRCEIGPRKTGSDKGKIKGR